MTLQELFLKERDIPYRIPLTTEELNDSCSGKHERLLHAFQQIGYESRYRICHFRWSDLQLPGWVSSADHEDDSTHLYLETRIDGVWKIIDATWDIGLSPHFSVNEWNLDSEMKVAVPATQILSPEMSAEYMIKLNPKLAQIDLEKNGKFYHELNQWLQDLRGGQTKNTP